MNLAATIERMEHAGMTPDAILLALKCVVVDEPKPSDAEAKLARKREADRLRMAQSRAMSRDSSATHAAKEIPPTPPKENTTTNTPTSARATASRGTRLPSDFSPLPAITELAKRLGLTEPEITDQLERFRDWYNAATGQAGVKMDWQGTCRNWIKRAADDKQRRNQYRNQLSSHGQAMRDAFAEVREDIGGAGKIVGFGDFRRS